MIFLCRVRELQRTGAKGVVLGEGADRLDVVIVDRSGTRHAYINACPHQFIPLETFPDHFFADDGRHLVCSGHGAIFVPETGMCAEGPCKGESLDRLTIVEREGAIYLDEPLRPAEIARQKKSRQNW